MIHLVCPGCGVKIKAKPELAGKTRKCPKCGGLIVVPKLEPAPTAAPMENTISTANAGADIIQANPAETRLPIVAPPERLNRRHRYLICDKTSVRAMWQDDGRGWMLKAASGFIAARRNAEVLPAHGQFTLVELELSMTDEGLRLAAINSYGLATRFAMTKLALGEDDILQAATGPGSLNRDQKNAVRQWLGEQFMREIWGDSREVIDFLGNADYHSYSSRAGEADS